MSLLELLVLACGCLVGGCFVMCWSLCLWVYLKWHWMVVGHPNHFCSFYCVNIPLGFVILEFWGGVAASPSSLVCTFSFTINQFTCCSYCKCQHISHAHRISIMSVYLQYQLFLSVHLVLGHRKKTKNTLYVVRHTALYYNKYTGRRMQVEDIDEVEEVETTDVHNRWSS